MIKVKMLEFSYHKGQKILDKINFAAEEGSFIAVLGNNGAGKSTLLKCLNRIICPQKGLVEVKAGDVLKMRSEDIAKEIAYVAQKNEAVRFTVFDAVLLGRKPYIRFKPTSFDYEITRRVMQKMKLEGMELRYLDELSGGELQKVVLARALVQQPQVLLLDEPTSNLDLKNQHAILEMLREIAHQDKISVIVVIHDLNLALRYCDKFLLLKEGRVLAYGGIDVMTPENIEEVYGLPVMIKKIRGIPVVIPLPEEEAATEAEKENLLQKMA